MYGIRLVAPELQTLLKKFDLIASTRSSKLVAALEQRYTSLVGVANKPASAQWPRDVFRHVSGVDAAARDLDDWMASRNDVAQHQSENRKSMLRNTSTQLRQALRGSTNLAPTALKDRVLSVFEPYHANLFELRGQALARATEAPAPKPAQQELNRDFVDSEDRFAHRQRHVERVR